MFRPITLLVLFAVSLIVTGQAFADGKIFNKSATAKVNIPDQEALIHYADGVETMVIQTSFTGEGDEFAWVVPTPSKPEVTASTTGLFPTLRTLTAPKVRMTGRFWSLWIWFFVMLICTGWLRLDYKPLLIIIMIILVILILLPALGTARSSAGHAVGVQVHQASTVGDFEVAVLSADDPHSLANWLNENEFQVSGMSREAIKAYTDDRWFFTAIRLKPDMTQSDTSATHPLAFRFPAAQPIYPMRLTATGSTSLFVDLYVFGHQRAAADRFEVTYCDRTVYPPAPTVEEWSEGWPEAGIPVRHPELLKRIEPSGFVTKLSAQLTPAEMQQDVLIRWDGEKTYVPRPWTARAAYMFALNTGMTGAALSLLFYVFTIPPERWGRVYINIKMSLGLLAGAAIWIVLACILYLALPITDARITKSWPILWRMQHRQLKMMSITVSDDHPSQSDPDDWLEEYIDYLQNPFSREEVKIGDEPGNFTYEWTDDELIITAYGPDGAPLRIDGSDTGWE